MSTQTITEQYTTHEADPRLRAYVMGTSRKPSADGTYKAHVSCRLLIEEGDEEALTLSMDLPVNGKVVPNFLYPDGYFDKVHPLRLLPWVGATFNYRWGQPR